MPSDEKFMPWRTISCHTWQQSLCCPLSQALCSRVMRCEADGTGKVSSHRFLNFSGASAEPRCVKRWNLSSVHLRTTGNGAAICAEEVGDAARGALGDFEVVLDGFSRNRRCQAILHADIPPMAECGSVASPCCKSCGFFFYEAADYT